jgi:hypothetical protein
MCGYVACVLECCGSVGTTTLQHTVVQSVYIVGHFYYRYCQTSVTTESLDRFSNISLVPNLIKIRPETADRLTDRETDMTKLIVALLQFYERAHKRVIMRTVRCSVPQTVAVY